MVQRWSAPVGREREEHLDPSREIPRRKYAGKPTICVRNSLNAAIVRYPSAPNFAAYNPPPFCLTCFTNYRLRSLDLTISVVNGVHEGTPSDRALSQARPAGGLEQIERMCHNWGVGRGDIAIHWIMHSNHEDDEFVQTFEGKPPP